MIVSFKDKKTKKIWNRTISKKFPREIQRTARRKLIQVDGALNLEDLKVPPGNHLHPLIKDRKGQHSININKQFRICFVWNNGNAQEVEITDYH